MDSVKQTPLSKDHIGGLWSQTQLDDATEDTFEAAVDFVRQVEKAHGIGVAEPAQQDTKAETWSCLEETKGFPRCPSWCGYRLGCPTAPQAPSVQQAERFTSYEVNILNGVADWLETRSHTVWARGNHDGLMRTWAKDLRDILAAQPSERPAPAGQAVEDAKKARRYEWLRATTNSFTNNAGHRINVKLEPEKWDEMIDAALASSQAERPAEEK